MKKHIIVCIMAILLLASFVSAIDIRPRIKDRQMACGLGNINLNEVYNFAELKQFVKDLTQCYYKPYTPGIDAPVLLDDTIADSATTKADLLNILENDMILTKRRASFSNEGVSKNAHASIPCRWYCENANRLPTVKGEADNIFGDTTNNQHPIVVDMVADDGSASYTYSDISSSIRSSIRLSIGHGGVHGSYSADIYVSNAGVRVELPNLPGELKKHSQHAAAIYGKSEAARSGYSGGITSREFSKQGQAIADEDYYGHIGTAPFGNWEQHNFGTITSTDKPTEWPIDPPDSNCIIENDNLCSGESVVPGSTIKGFEIRDIFALVTWDFCKDKDGDGFCPIEDCDDETLDDPTSITCPTLERLCNHETARCAICIHPASESSQYRVDDIQVFLDPSYISETILSRDFTPTKITPYSNIIVEIKVLDCGVPITPPYANIWDVEGQLTTGTSSDVLFQEKFSSRNTDFSFFKSVGDHSYYHWKIKGTFLDIYNNYGFLESENALKILVDSGNDWAPVRAKVVKDNIELNARTFPVDFCVQIGGSGNIAFIGTTSTNNFLGVVNAMEDIMEDGFYSIDPFKRFENKLSFFADLKYFDDSSWLKKPIINVPGKMVFIMPPAFNKINSQTSCNNPNPNYIYFNDGSLNYASKSIPIFFTSSDSHAESMQREGIAVHETGHSLCKLDDEYKYGLLTYFTIPVTSSKNCIYAMAPCSWEWGSYGNCYTRGCANVILGKIPSNGSIMNAPVISSGRFEDPRFNTVGCAYCLKKILPGGPTSMEPYFKYCNSSNMDIIRRV